MQCQSCGAEIPAANKFCGECGSPPPQACTACGHTNPVGAKFCSECGARLRPSNLQTKSTTPPREIAPSTKTSLAERRQLTIMFCDMVGSSELSTRLDPEEQRDVVSAFQSCCATEINRLSGMVARQPRSRA